MLVSSVHRAGLDVAMRSESARPEEAKGLQDQLAFRRDAIASSPKA